MKLPSDINARVISHYQPDNWAIIHLDSHNQVINLNQTAQRLFPHISQGRDIRDGLPLLATETLDTEFYLPFSLVIH